MESFVHVVIEDARWEAAALEDLAQRAALATFAELGLPAAGFTLCVMGCDDTRIAALNADFRGKPSPTNVLSWPSEERGAEIAGQMPEPPQAGDVDEPDHLGDIAIAFDTCLAEAEAGNKPLTQHTTHLIAHGLLHILGFDHIRERDGDLMEAVEARIMARLGLPDPYDTPEFLGQ